ncbi:MAG: hypothetical protein ABSD41_10950 [Candidatus Bathyarchaeia archaeon]|jgi:hypothetical protein
MSSKLSLTVGQLEILCEMYYQVRQFTIEYEGLVKELPHIVKAIKSKKTTAPKHLLRLRIFLNFAFDQTLETDTADLFGQLDVEPKKRRTVEREISRLRISNILLAKKSEKTKGRWSNPHSRNSESGRPAYRYSLNPLLIRDYVTNDYVDIEARRFLTFAEKFLLGTPAFKECYERIWTAHYGMITSPEFAEFIDIAQRIPEIDSLLKRVQKRTNVNGYEKAKEASKKMAFVIPAEIAPPKMQTLDSEEHLSWEEARRLVDARLL